MSCNVRSCVLFSRAEPLFFAIGILLVGGSAIHAQYVAGGSGAPNMASSYLAAAQAYNNAAAQCKNPAGAACMRSYANYEACVANQFGGGGSCSAPTCSTACGVAVSGAGAGITALSPAMSAAAKMMAAEQNKLQNVDNLVNMGISLFSLFHSNNSDNSQPDANGAPTPDPAAEAAAAAAAQQQANNEEAAQWLADANAMMASTSAPPAPAQPDPNATLDNLLDDNDQPTDSSTAAITGLLNGDDSQPDSGTSAAAPSPAPDPTSEVSALLDGPAAINSGATPSLNPMAANPLFAGAAAQSQDPAPDSSQVDTLDNDLLGDGSDSADSVSMWDSMKETATSWANAAGDLFNSHPLQSIAQGLGLTPNPNADPIDAAIHTCGVDLMAGAGPYPVGADAGAAGCMTAIQKQGMGILGMATDQMGSQ